jgi:predicted nucleotidyltransferase
MDIDTIHQPLSQFLQTVSKRVKVEEMLLFGSYLEGTATAESDIDVVVVSDDFRRMRHDKRLDLLDAAAEGIAPEIQAWGFTTRELEHAPELSTLWHARTAGVRFVGTRS